MLLRGVAHTQRVVDLPMQAPPGPHAPGQRHGRQKAPAQGVTVGPDLALRGLRQKVEPVPQRWHFTACGLASVIAVEQGTLTTQRGGHDLIG